MCPASTKIYVTCPEGDVLIDDFSDEECLRCIDCKQKAEGVQLVCRKDNQKKRVAVVNTKSATLYICDTRERNSKNFNALVSLYAHSMTVMVEKWRALTTTIRKDKRHEIDTFKHNIEHINSESINHFYTFVSQETLLMKFSKMLEIIEEKVRESNKSAARLIAELARYNTNIKIELSVLSKLNNPAASLNTCLLNPRDVIMTSIYMLYPDFKKNNVYVEVDEYYSKITSDFEALQVAGYYIIENVSKYAMPGSKLKISFEETDAELVIHFEMTSLYIHEEEESHLFEEGYKGANARKSGKSGKGIGLYRARKLITLCGGDLRIDPGIQRKTFKGLEYAENQFMITLPM